MKILVKVVIATTINFGGDLIFVLTTYPIFSTIFVRESFNYTVT